MDSSWVSFVILGQVGLKLLLNNPPVSRLVQIGDDPTKFVDTNTLAVPENSVSKSNYKDITACT